MNTNNQMAIDLLRTEMRIIDARLTDALLNEEGLRSLHRAANAHVALLWSIKRDIQARTDSIFFTKENARKKEAVGSI